MAAAGGSQVIVKEAGLGDMLDIWGQIPEFAESSSEAPRKCKEKLGGKTTLCLLAEVNGVPAGFLIAYEKYGDKSLYVWMAGVKETFRRKGVLSAMFDRCHAWALANGFGKLSIKTRNSRREMLAYLVKNGFEFISVEPRESVDENRIMLEKGIR